MMLAKALASASASAPKLYIEDVMASWLYTGNSSTQTITNGIDLSGKGGLVWIKSRSLAQSHFLFDTERGADKALTSNDTAAQSAGWTPNWFTSFNSSGFTLGPNGLQLNSSTGTYASWTFRKAAKFFDVVTYTGTGSAQAVSHNLGTAPGFIVAKQTNNTSDWIVYHRSSGATKVLTLNSTGAEFTAGHWDNTTPTSTQFYVGGGGVSNNLSGGTYVAYLFAHDAGGFGDSGNESVVKCGSFQDGPSFSGQLVNLGWEPQWVMIKRIGNADVNSTFSANWQIYDVMRGLGVENNLAKILRANTTDAEISNQSTLRITSQGFVPNLWVNTNDTYIYIAIRRGPMKTPTDATKVFDVDIASDSAVIPTNFPVDAFLLNTRTSSTNNTSTGARLTGTQQLITSSTAAEAVDIYTTAVFANNAGYRPALNGLSSAVNYAFRRAPGFFDVVAYTGTGVAHGEAHNLGVAPELVIWKERSTASNWYVYQGFTTRTYGRLNLTNAFSGNSPGWFSSVTATHLNVCASSDNTDVNDSGVTYIAYLFATCPGVSKVGSYTGTGTTLSVDCGFTNGARFVLIKRTDSTGDWYVWDTARGIVSGNDPYLLLNSTAAEVTNTDYIDPLSSGFQISSTAPAAINASGGSFIFLAIA